MTDRLGVSAWKECLAGSALAQKKRTPLEIFTSSIINLKSLEKFNIFSPSNFIDFPRSRYVSIQKRLKLVDLILEKG